MESDGARQGGSPLLASMASATPFVPAAAASPHGRGGWGGGSPSGGAGADARPLTPVADRSGSVLGAGARPFVPGNGVAPQAASSGGRISAGAAAFVPSGGGSPSPATRSPAMSTAAPAFVPKGLLPDGPQPGRSGRPGPLAAELRLQHLPEAQQPFGFPAAEALPDARGGTSHGLSPHPSPRQGYGPGAGRGGRGRAGPEAAAIGARLLQGQQAIDGGPGRGRGRGGFSRSGPHAPLRGFGSGPPGALARQQAAAAAAAEQLLPQLQTQAYMTLAQMPPEMVAETRLPESVRHFHSLFPLEDLRAAEEAPPRAFPVRSLVLKGVSVHDGAAVALRRVSRRQVLPSHDLLAHAADVVQAWACLGAHPGLGVPRAAFASPEPASLFIAHDYRPAAVTLEAARLQPQVAANGLVQVAAAREDELWGYLVQLAAGLQAVHSVGLACRAALHPSKLLVTTGDRLLIGSLGVAEIVAGRSARNDDVTALQAEDLRAVGGCVLALACAGAPHPSLEACAQRRHSPELTRLLAGLLGQGQPVANWRQLSAAVAEHALAELDARALHADALTGQLAREAENGRLLRLLAKLSMVTERADADPDWAETGDRYLLKLFRDFVFHQCTEDGAPLLEWGHVAECLAKLDAGAPEKVLLLSRDEASMLVVSYADVRRCLAGAFGDLQSRAALR